MKEATSAPAIEYYDYIIIGGGTSGCPLAATLSQGARVLVLERGGSPYNNTNITNMENFAKTLSDTSPTSPAQQFVSQEGVFNVRPRVLGGGSAVNGGFYTHASTHYVKETGWDETLVNQSYEWVEKLVVFWPSILEWQSAVRDGLLEVGVLPYNGLTYDHLYGTKVGGTIFDGEGHRHTAADLLEYADPTRITVYLHATVYKILFRHNIGKARPRANGVVFKDTFGVMHKAYLIKNSMSEIILSAGAIGSPQLLMLSGIGPRDQLEAHGIEVVLDQPLVGQGMADNPMNMLFVPSPQPVEVSLTQTVGITRFGSFIEANSGLSFLYSSAQNLSRDSGLLIDETDQPFTVPPEAMAEAAETINAIANGTIKGGVILEKVIGPLSTGHLELQNTNPNDNPSVTFNYFKEPKDLKRCVKGMSTVIDVINSYAFSKFRYSNMTVQALTKLMLSLPVNKRPRHANATISLKQFCIDTVVTIWHYHGGCQVGKVVDRDYKVVGVDALRVIDGSTFLRSPGTNPQATVMMLGRYMGEKILHERGQERKQELDIREHKIGVSFCYSEKAPNYSFLLKATSAPTNANYDYIIIGGGTASCALAATLSQDTSLSSPFQHIVSQDGVINARPRILGGGSALNAGFYMRASASYIKEAGWNETLVNESYQWAEKLVAFKPPMLQWQSAVRDGLLEAGVLPDNGFTYDHFYGTKAGGIIFDKDGHRHCAADLLEYANPIKIKVYLHATVYNILFRSNNDALGTKHTAYLNNNSMNEIILSAGAIGSPQLLMLTGIGPVDELQAQGIKVVLDQPMVGQDMADNPMNFVFVPSPNPVEVSLIQVVGITKSDSYIEAASGLSIGSSWAQKISGSILKFLLKTGLASEVLLEMALVAGNVNKTIRGGVIIQKTNGPISKGNLKLLSMNPNLNPSVTFNYYKEPEDLKKCVDGMKTIMSVISSEALMELMLYLPVNMRKKHLSASISLEQFCIDIVTTIWHYHGGCQVGKVVDTNYRVLGVDALRVIDGSTFNSSPGTNPQATVMMLGRYMGQKILQERLSNNGK
uniref:Glucose-methanol-choline oxidoreductase N-terminal domain-containing protein n=1 Tax=Fagus sylvatica TaxID=28930 RepID=A0A2N9FVK0_FAGSY